MPSVLRIKNPDGTWYEVTALKGDTGPQGLKGDTGITPNLQVGTVTTGNPGTSAEVTITGTPEEPVLNFKIPKGEPGTGGGGSGYILPTATKQLLGGIKVGEDLKIAADGTLSVDKVTEVADNTKPITAAAVYKEVGNINALLATI